ncbi:2OG-Fe(II) oxygenase [Arenibacter sp. GZD96]|uniref:2OG-Fe(II) oxygenase n=1 Tax=Aurantibrevibacter litoralis TaxID=3106030 RepID=UPI002AFFB3A2|nr:2OG-Fe(II) oxygenase [Arenibacter sp. GZD-96]MEA1787261.1 2OG-Fe(II) oxygenase [Arenibacter sp. GZD-96]
MAELFEQLDFVENPLYERVISDLLAQQYSIVDDFFSSAIVEKLRLALLENYDKDQFKKAAIGNASNAIVAKAIRGDFILWMDECQTEPAEKLFFNRINDLARYLNKTCFLGIMHTEFHYALYPKGTFYKRHLDTFQNDDRRKLSMVCYLNLANWQPEDEGELVLYVNENGIELSKKIHPLSGRMVIFESQVLEHEVKPAKRDRLSITGWLKTR